MGRINPFLPNGYFYCNSLDRSISNRKGVWLVIIIKMLIGIPLCNANSVDPNQMPRSAASDLGLQCLPVSR